MVKCRYCGKSIDKETAYSPKPRTYYCDETCYNAKAHKEKQKTIQEETLRRKLTDYIQSYYTTILGWNKASINWNMLMSQIKNLRYNYGYKDGGILLTLKYMEDNLDRNLYDEKTKSILNLIPFYYQDAKEHYIRLQNCKKMAEEYNFADDEVVFKTTKTINTINDDF